MKTPDVCCGFGGTFCVKYPDISNAIVGEKDRPTSSATGAGTLLAGDLGCLMNMAGKLQRDGSAVQVRHVAEVLAGMTATCRAIGESRDASAADESTAPAFKDNATHALADPNLQKALAMLKAGFIDKRRRPAAERLPEFEALRDRARDIKNHTLAHLDLYLEAYRGARSSALGGHVHWAPTAARSRDASSPTSAASAGRPHRRPRASR